MPYDVFRQGPSQNVSYAAAGGASAASTAVGSQTRAVMICAVGVASATLDGVRIRIGNSPTASATSTLIPLNQAVIFGCGPGQQVAVLGNNTGTGTVCITELTT